MTFGAMALVNDTFLQLVRTETHRGLEGRALGGFWTGGRCFGYKTWGHTTIRAMLSNQRYIGRFIWNQSKWVRVSGRKSRRRVERPKSEWITQECPELAIVPIDLWEAVQGRFRRVYATARGRPAGTGHHGNLVSGLLRCGVCGGSMTVVSRKSKAGVSYARFGCTAHFSRGAAICTNGLSISERRASRALVHALREKLDRPELLERFVSSFRERAAALAGKKSSGTEDADRRIRDCERRIGNVTDALAKLGWSDALAARLRDEEAQLNAFKSERTSAARVGGSCSMPDVAVISSYLRNLLPLLEADPSRGREILSRFVAPIVMTPKAEGPVRHYQATGAFNLAFFLSGVSPESRAGKSGCAGRI